MKSQAYFEKIYKEIESRLMETTSSIRLAVAWFTDPKLFAIICDKAKSGLKVEVMLANHEINFDSTINHRELIDNGGALYWIGYDYSYAPLMHNKFCIIDDRILIFGSYNWTKKAKSNHESITVIEEDDNLILDFNQEFDKLLNKYVNENESATDWTKIIIRLDILVNAIKLEDYDDIKYQIEKTKKLLSKSSNEPRLQQVENALHFCSKKQYIDALNLIQVITREFKKIIIFEDPEISALQLEIRSLQFQITSLDDEKTDIEKAINHFTIKYNEELGQIIKRILFIKKELSKQALKIDGSVNNQKEYDEASNDYEEFSRSYEEKIKDSKPNEISEEQQKELKKLKREASKLCHPDKVVEEQRLNAQAVFVELNKAYENNDLQSVKSILNDLRKGVFKTKGENVTEKDKLIVLRKELIIKRESLEKELVTLKRSEVIKQAMNLENIDAHLLTLKTKFLKILNELESKYVSNGKEI